MDARDFHVILFRVILGKQDSKPIFNLRIL